MHLEEAMLWYNSFDPGLVCTMPFVAPCHCKKFDLPVNVNDNKQSIVMVARSIRINLQFFLKMKSVCGVHAPRRRCLNGMDIMYSTKMRLSKLHPDICARWKHPDIRLNRLCIHLFSVIIRRSHVASDRLSGAECQASYG